MRMTYFLLMCGLNTFIWHMYTYEVNLHLCMSVPVSIYVTVEVREDLWKSSSTTLYLKFESGISLHLDPTLLHRFDWPQSSQFSVYLQIK